MSIELYKKYFKESEVQCQCGCGMTIKDSLKEALGKARDIAELPFVITSGARCKKHNAAVGGAENSRHTYGDAVDIVCLDGFKRFTIMKALLKAGFTGIGNNFTKNFIHADLRPNPSVFPY